MAKPWITRLPWVQIPPGPLPGKVCSLPCRAIGSPAFGGVCQDTAF